MRYVLVIDVPGIKEYVFGTERLVEIRGGSGLLDHLNRNRALECLNAALDKDNVKCVFAGGGAGQFIVTANEDNLQIGIRKLKGLFRESSKGGLRLICGYSECPTEDDYKQSLARAFMRMNAEKDEIPFSEETLLHTGLFRCE